mgnify:CR=1 FL=1
MTLTKIQKDTMQMTYAEAQIQLIESIKSQKYSSLQHLIEVLDGWHKIQVEKLDLLHMEYHS